MPWRDIGLNAAGLVLYPGVAAAALFGLVLEVAGWISAPWASAGERTPWRIMPRARSFAVRSGPLLPSLLAGLLAVVASVQLAAPFSPIPAADRNLLTAGVSLAGGAWILHAGDRRRDLAQPGLVLSAQLAWLVALLVPAIIPQTLKPQTLGYVTLGPDLPVKVACGLLYLLCLPALLRLAPESPGPAVPDGSGRPAGAGPGDLTVPRLLLWLPYCGLFASLFLPPGSDSPAELLRFLGVVFAAGASTIVIALVLRHLGAAFSRRFYLNVVVPFAWISVGVGMLSAALESR